MKTVARSAASAEPLFRPSLASSRARRLAERTTVVLLGTLFVAVCAHVAVPLWFTPVPVTLQTFAVLLLGLVLSPRMAALTLGAYLVEGAAGLPVFSPVGAPTFLHLLGPTGGYLLSYPAVAWLTGTLFRRLRAAQPSAFVAALGAAALGDALILLSGAAWLAVLTHQSAVTVFTLAVAPFLAGDILKVIAAAGAVPAVRRFRRLSAPKGTN